jgi:hypothetical protein
MSKIPLSEEDLLTIIKNPNVESASPVSVKFTFAFKQKAYEERLAGKTPYQIFTEAGFDVDALGYDRIRGFFYHLKKKHAEGFLDGRRSNYHHPPKTGKETAEDRIKQLENELAYTRQEVEFLKKIQLANLEAQKEWESKHRQK